MAVRTIIFRGKRIDNGEWVEGSYCHGDRPPMLLEEDEIMPYSEVIGNVHDNKELWGGNEL